MSNKTSGSKGSANVFDVLSITGVASKITAHLDAPDRSALRLVSKGMKSAVMGTVHKAQCDLTCNQTHIPPLCVPAGSQLKMVTLSGAMHVSAAPSGQFLQSLSQWPNVEKLGIAGVNLALGPTPVMTFLAPLVKLQSLKLSECGVDNRQLQLLMQAPFSPHLRSLDLSQSHDIAQGLVAVAHVCTALTALVLQDCMASEEKGVTCTSALAYGGLRHLRCLDLTSACINEVAAGHLANGAWNQLTCLDLDETALKAPAVAALMKAKWWGNVVDLHIYDGLADHAAVLEFAKGDSKNLTYLEFGGDDIDPMPVFQRAAALPKLRALHIACARMEEQGVAALSVAPWNLCSLHVACCWGLDDSALLALAQGSILRGLTELDISNNDFTADGLLQFADAARGKSKSIATLDVSNDCEQISCDPEY